MVSNLRKRISYTLLLVCLLPLLLAACGGNSADEGEGDSGGGTGTLRFLYFSAADCAPCEGMTPIIDGIEQDFTGKLTLERYDAASEEGKKLMEQYELRETPSYTMIGADGTKLWALTGAIHKDMLRQQVQMRAQ